jgi:hypothetical protein
MLTVHKLPLTHLFLAENQTAKEAREVGIMEALVVIDRGLVVSVNTTPAGLDEFGSDDDWIAQAIEDAYRRGLAPTPRGSSLGDPEQVTPEGWTHWRDLTPGTVATSGDEDDAPYLLLGAAGCFRARGGSGVYNAARLGARRLPWTLQHNPAAPPPWPFYKVLRTGLSGETLHHLAAAVESGEDIKEALARLAPLAA